jgi:hypothetical protein
VDALTTIEFLSNLAVSHVDKWAVVNEWVSSKREEDLHLDFKEKGRGSLSDLDDSDKRNLSKSLSAFANTEGGLLIFGIGTKDRGKQPDCATDVLPIKNIAFFKQRIEARLKDATDPPVVGVRLVIVEDPDSPGDGLLAIYAPQSSGGPHRAAKAVSEVNDRYFARTSSRSDVMSHAHLAAMFGRPPHPELRLRLLVSVKREGSALAVNLHTQILNVGRGVARRPALRLDEANPHHRGFWGQIQRGGVNGWTVTYGPPGELPNSRLYYMFRSEADTLIYPGDSWDVHPLTTSLGKGFGAHVFPITVKAKIYATEGPPVSIDETVNFSVSYNEGQREVTLPTTNN